MKNTIKDHGLLNRDEFRKGILLGYWNRQVQRIKINTDDSKNDKTKRWVNGNIDIECVKILKMVHKENTGLRR